MEWGEHMLVSMIIYFSADSIREVYEFGFSLMDRVKDNKIKPINN